MSQSFNMFVVLFGYTKFYLAMRFIGIGQVGNVQIKIYGRASKFSCVFFNIAGIGYFENIVELNIFANNLLKCGKIFHYIFTKQFSVVFK